MGTIQKFYTFIRFHEENYYDNFNIQKETILFFLEHLMQLYKNIKVVGMVQPQWKIVCVCFFLIYSSSTDTRYGSFSEMHGKLNKCESRFHIVLHKAWTISRIQSNVNERTTLYLTSDTLAQSGLLNVCLTQNDKNRSFQHVPTSLSDQLRSSDSSHPFQSPNIHVLGLYQSCGNVFV